MAGRLGRLAQGSYHRLLRSFVSIDDAPTKRPWRCGDFAKGCRHLPLMVVSLSNSSWGGPFAVMMWPLCTHVSPLTHCFIKNKSSLEQLCTILMCDTPSTCTAPMFSNSSHMTIEEWLRLWRPVLTNLSDLQQQKLGKSETDNYLIIIYMSGRAVG